MIGVGYMTLVQRKKYVNDLMLVVLNLLGKIQVNVNIRIESLGCYNLRIMFLDARGKQ